MGRQRNERATCEGTSEKSREASPTRTDEGRLHVVRNSVFSRGLLEALRRNGQNIRQLRGMERGLRSVLRPKGPLGELFFVRFWASILRLILASQVEAKLLVGEKTEAPKKPLIPDVFNQIAPMLVTHLGEDDPTPNRATAPFNSEVPHQLALIARYDRSASRELYRCLNILLLLRDQDGDSGLQDWASALAGIKPNRKDKENG